MGLRHQFLPPYLRPLHEIGRTPVLCGLAMPVLETDIYQEPAESHPLDDRPFGRMLEALDDLRPEEVYVCAGASHRYALVGELMATAMQARRGVGAVCDGYIRDVPGLLNLDFPVFSLGPYGQDQRGRGLVIDYRIPVEIGGILIRPGDVIFGDTDGVLVVPSEHVHQVFQRALDKARGEKTVKHAIENGMGAAEAFEKYGIM
jgi:regulator of RNase E activity RraA